MHEHGEYQLIDEFRAPHSVGVCLRAVDAVRQFHNAYHRKRAFCISASGMQTFDYLLDSFSVSLTGDQNAGIED